MYEFISVVFKRQIIALQEKTVLMLQLTDLIQEGKCWETVVRVFVVVILFSMNLILKFMITV